MMETVLLVLVIILIAAVIVLQLWLDKRSALELSAHFTKLDPLQSLLVSKMDNLHGIQLMTDHSVRDEISKFRTELQTQTYQDRETLNNTIKAFGDSLQSRIVDNTGSQGAHLERLVAQLKQLTETNESKMEAVRQIVDEKLKNIQEDNSRQLERMRQTVDEKLQSTLEKRLGESFRLVSERLEQVHQGLGDMRNLAAGVGDLKKVLTNIKTRGTWGEVQLGALLQELLSPEQYVQNAKIQENNVVEFAIKLPGQGELKSDHVLIPIDAKFPIEDYQRLMDAQDSFDSTAADEAAKSLESSIKKAAKDIFTKYIAPPKTTDFGIMFLPSEGLYAEVIRRTALMQILQKEYHVIVSGPSTFAAFLNSLQMGFRSLAIQKRSGEVWKVLSEVKLEFDKFGITLDGVRKKLVQATDSMDDVQKKSRNIQRKLFSVHESPETVSTDELEDNSSAVLDND
jgi:DNA recombination protein RmuC